MPPPRGWKHPIAADAYWRSAIVLFFNYGYRNEYGAQSNNNVAAAIGILGIGPWIRERMPVLSPQVPVTRPVDVSAVDRFEAKYRRQLRFTQYLSQKLFPLIEQCA